MYLNIINERVKRFTIKMKQRFITEVCLYEPLTDACFKYFCITQEPKQQFFFAVKKKKQGIIQ